MSNNIKNIFGENNEPIKVKASKFCDICQEAFSRTKKDNFNLDYCTACIKTDKISAVAHWKNHFSKEKANTLPPHLAALKEKLAKNRSLVEGTKFERLNENLGIQRSLSEISASQSQNAPSFESVRQQVGNLLPSILAEMGVDKKVDAELLIDAIIPTKISAPIYNTAAAKSVLREIVAETLSNLNMDKAFRKEALVKTHGQVKNSNDVSVLNEGYGRVSNDYGNRSRRIANPMNQMQLGEQPDTEIPPQQDSMGDFAPPETDDDEEGKVIHLPDDEANQLIQEKSSPEDSQNPEIPPEPPLNEGIGTYSGAGGEAQVPDASEMDELPQDGGVKRVESSVADFISRRIQEKKAAKIKRPAAAELLSVAGKLPSTAPVQIVHLAEKDKNIIEAYPPLNFATAAYSDGSKKTFKCYATDRGYFYINDDFSVHSKNSNKFAEFIASDPSFVKWAFLPEVDEKEPLAPDHDVEDMALPTSPEMCEDSEDNNGDPGFNEIKETHLNSSPNNQIPSGGMGDDPQPIFDNGNPGVNDSAEDDLLDTATHLLEKIQEMFPESTPENQNDLAISAALLMIEDNLKKKSKGVNAKLSKKAASAWEPIKPAGYGKGYGIFEPNPESHQPENLNKSYSPNNTKPSSTKPVNPVKPLHLTVNINKSPTPAIKSLPTTSTPPALPPASANLIDKAASLMPFINETYALESEDYRLSLALEAAKNLIKTAEPVADAAMESPEISQIPMATRKPREKNQTIGNEASVAAIKPFHSQQMMKSLSDVHPDFAAASEDPDKAHALFQEIARGGRGAPPLNFTPTHVLRPANMNKALDNYGEALRQHFTPQADGDDATVPGAKKRLGDRFDDMFSRIPTEDLMDIFRKKDDSAPAQPKVKKPFPVSYPRSPEEIAELQKSREEQSTGKPLGNKFKTFQPIASKVNELINLTADMSEKEFEFSASLLMDLGYSDKEILSAFASLQKKAEGDDINGSTDAVYETATHPDPKMGLPEGEQKTKERLDGLRDWEDEDEK
jgi:hypothetical protein